VKNRTSYLGIAISILIASVAILFSACGAAPEPVRVLRIPEEGRMPQAVNDKNGLTHLMYFRGAMSGGDLYYSRWNTEEPTWTAPIRINSEPRTSIGMGPMDGGDMALTTGNTATPHIHAVWFQNNPLRLFYTRSTEGGDNFEPQRTLIEIEGQIIEARPSIATDGRDQIFIAWHGAPTNKTDDANRAVFLMTSEDGGETFGPPRVISPPEEGACGCCSLELFFDEGTVWVSYRGAEDNVGRGQRLLRSTGPDQMFADELIQPWSLGACPVTTTTFAKAPDRVRVAWETAGEIYFAEVNNLADVVSPDGEAKFRRKNATIATNNRGETLLAWGDAPGYRAGGTLNWQLFDSNNRAISEMGPNQDTIPSGSGPAVTVQSDDTFLLLY